MIEIGRVLEVWRYPVSSVGGENIDHIDVSAEGVSGDRRFGLFDQRTGLSAAPEQEPRWRPALFLSADRGDAAMPQIRFPDSGPFWLDDSGLDARLADYFGFPAGIGAYGDLTDGADFRFPVISNRYAPTALHLLTTASLAKLAEVGGFDALDRRRFRPSVLIETGDAEGFVENHWIGKTLSIGDLQVTVTEGTRRCGMTLVAQPGSAEDPGILRTIMRHNARNLGVYATVSDGGRIAAGVPVYAES
jgi:uncharacterized protein YcbX